MDSLRYTVQAAADGHAFSGARVAALLGVLFHLAIRGIEFELVMFHFLAAGSLVFSGLIVAFGLPKASLFALSFDVGVFASIAVYRLVWHRCRSFPGPFAAKLTRFYAARLSAKDLKYYKELAKMHEQYGDFVRTGPREISILSKDAVPLIYGPNTKTLKSTWYGQTGNDPKKCSIHMTRDFNDHRIRKRAWDKGFSVKALGTYEPRIKTKADLMVRQFAKNSGNPIDATAWSMFFSFDVMGEVGFGKDFNNLASGTEHTAIQAVHAHMSMLGILSTVPWLLNVLGSIPGAAAGYAEFFSFCAGQIREKHETWDAQQYPQDVVSWLLKAVKEKDVSASPSAIALEDDSRVMIIAGSETTATTLASILFYLAKCPDKQKKLQDELDKAMPGGPGEWSYEKVKTVSYVDEFINETLRLRPALLTGGPRETPAEGLQVGNTYIPGNTNVLVSTYLVHRDPRWWQEPEAFLPERFGERREEMGTDNSPYLPFSLGHYGCPGKALALLSLRTSLSTIAQNLDVSFAPGETGDHFEKETLDTFTVTLPPLKLQFTPRKRD